MTCESWVFIRVCVINFMHIRWTASLNEKEPVREREREREGEREREREREI